MKIEGRLSPGRLVYPGCMLTSVGVALVLQGFGVPAPVVAGLVALVMMATVAVIEKVLPHASQWAWTWRSLGLDAVHALVTSVAVAPAVKAGLTVLAGSAAVQWLYADVGTPWPGQLWLPAQLFLAILVADLGAYLGHRWMHATDIGWRIHAVHHSPKGLNFMASARSHPLNAGLTTLMETGPLVLLGVPPTVLVLWSAIKVTNGLLQHANIGFQPGVWSAFFATPEMHRWHHSAVRKESDTNFGNTTSVWDRVFGSLLLPKDRRARVEVGIPEVAIPENYWVHLAVPFVLLRYAVDPEGPLANSHAANPPAAH